MRAAFKRTFLPAHENLVALSATALFTLVGTWFLPKWMDNGALFISDTFFEDRDNWLVDSTQWIEDHASIWQIIATPREETKAEVIQSSIGNVTFGISVLGVATIGVMGADYVSRKKMPWHGDDYDPDEEVHFWKKSEPPEP